MQPDDNERRRRARAIWAYSRQSQDQLADAAGIHYDRLRAILGSTGRPPTIDELLALARVARVPDVFVLHGFADELEERVARLEEIVTRRIEALGGPRPPGGLGRFRADPAPTRADRPRGESQPAEEPRQGEPG